MPNLFADTDIVIVAALAFVAAMLLVEALLLLWSGSRGTAATRLSRRMQALASHSRRNGAQVLKDSAWSRVPGLERHLAAVPLLQGVQRFLQQANVRWTVAQALLASLVLGLGGFLLVAGPGTLLTGLMVGAGLGALPWAVLAIKRARRLRSIHRQLPDALDFMCRALRSGQAFTAALLLAGEELPDPFAAELRAVHDEITFGVSPDQALSNLAARLPIMDLRCFVVSVLVQRESGGNLTEVLENLGRLIRERYKLQAKIKVLAANGRFSALILGLAPFVLGTMMYLVNPKFMSLLWTDPIGVGIVKVLGLMLLVGGVILNRMSQIRV